ncbi:MAG: hypothetical protein WEF50_21485 [Myxococcota bacterium]
MSGAKERDAGKRRELTKRDRFWLGHLQAIARGDESASAYARRKGLSVGALYQGMRRLEERGAWTRAAKSVSFAPVVVRDEAEPAPGALRLRLANGAELAWSSVPEVEWLAALVERIGKRA